MNDEQQERVRQVTTTQQYTLGALIMALMQSCDQVTIGAAKSVIDRDVYTIRIAKRKGERNLVYVDTLTHQALTSIMDVQTVADAMIMKMNKSE